MSNIQQQQQKTVIIIGAGIAGLKAASDLYKSGVNDILVLEARNRIGGRLLTIKTPEGNTYDLGASWFHDTLSNPLFQKYVMNENHTQIYYDDVSTEFYGYNSEADSIEVDDNDNDNNSDKGFKVPEEWGLTQVMEEMEKFIEMANFNDLNSEDTLLFNTVIEYIYQRRKLLTPEQIKWAPELIRHVEAWHGISWKMMSSKYSVDDNEGRNALNLDGYSKILQDILSSIPEEIIKTGIQVKLIEKVNAVSATGSIKNVNSNNTKVKITTVANESIVADYVICTVPQSILALPVDDEGSLLFEPKLPPYISNPLKKMHFGALGKVVLEFKSEDEIFWNRNVDRFVVLAKPNETFTKFSETMAANAASADNNNQVYKPDYDDTPVPLDVHDKYFNYEINPQNIPRYDEHPIMFFNYYASKGAPTLVALTQSPVTNYIENASLEETWEFLKPALFVIASQNDNTTTNKKVNNKNNKTKNIANGSSSRSSSATVRNGNGHHNTKQVEELNDIPIPKNIFKTHWTRDPFSRGSYAACGPGDDPTDLIIGLVKGHGANVRFAGEHTIFEGAGCAHGAWLSGKREANFILSDLGVLKDEDTYID